MIGATRLEVVVHPELVGAAEALQLQGELKAIESASANSQEKLQVAREYLQESVGDHGDQSDIIACGSLAREEFTAASDFDYLVVSYGLSKDPRSTRTLLGLADSTRSQFEQATGGAPAERPGATKLFGVSISASSLTERIGLQDDTNHDQTRRLLILEESVSLLHPQKHTELVRTILQRYLVDYEDGKNGVPRFLLNDVIKYWRTLAVDYQAKLWTSQNEWGLRYLKLLISRKLAYAGTLTSLLLCSKESPATVERLQAQFSMPPLARLAQLHSLISDEAESADALRTALTTADHFLAASSDKDWRNDVKKVTSLEEAREEPDSAFWRMRQHAVALQDALEVLFFRSEALGTSSRKYLAF